MVTKFKNKILITVLFFLFVAPAFAMDAPEKEQCSFQNLPLELKDLIITTGKEQAQTVQEAIGLINCQAAVNRELREITKKNVPQIIDYLVKKFPISALSIVFNLGPDLAESWLTENFWDMQALEQVKKLSKKSRMQVVTDLLVSRDLMAVHGADIVDYFAYKFRIFPYAFALTLQDTSKQWFVKKGLLQEVEKLDKAKLEQLHFLYNQQGLELIEKVKLGNKEQIRFLLETDSDPNFQDNESCTPLMEVSLYRRKDIVELLLKYNVNPNIKNKYGYTALRQASFGGYKAVVELLLQHGADPNIQSDNGYTALDYAKRNGHTEIVKILEKAMAKQEGKQ